MEIENLVDIDKILKVIKKKYTGYRNKLIAVMSLFGLNKKELELYVMLLKKQLKIKEISKRLGLSDRVVRRYIKEMLERKFIKRKVVEGKRLAYKYLSVSPVDVWKNIKSEVRRNITFIDEKIAPELEDYNASENKRK